MSEIEWLSSGEVVNPAVVDMGEARALVIGPDDRLVVVMPGDVRMFDLQAHADRIREAIGNRFVILAGNDIRLAKVKANDWDRPALDR
jgi:hypothetical protein